MPVLTLTRRIAAFAAVPAVLFVVARPAHVDGPERSVEFQDGSGSTVVSVEAGAPAIFYVSDPGLATVLSGTATWTALPIRVPADTLWILITGAPYPGGLSIVADGYSTSSSALTPITSVPTAKIDGLAVALSDLEPVAGGFALQLDANTSSSVVIDFDFDVVDLHAANERLVRVASGSDPVGEWSSLAEVSGGSDASASPTSHLFLGEVLLSLDSASVGQGDGAVWVQPGDTLTVTYYEHGGVEAVSSHEVLLGFAAVGLRRQDYWPC